MSARLPVVEYADTNLSLLDDLKSMVLSKYPHSLAAAWDTPDISFRLLQTGTSGYDKRFRRERSPTRSLSPSLNSQNSFLLEPDQEIWKFLDTYFPNGMTSSDALTIETPTSTARETSFSQRHNRGPDENDTRDMRNLSSRDLTPTPFSPDSFHDTKLRSKGQTTSFDDRLIDIQQQQRRSVEKFHNRRHGSVPLVSHQHARNQSISTPNATNPTEAPGAVLLLPKNFAIPGKHSSISKNAAANKHSQIKPKPTTEVDGSHDINDTARYTTTDMGGSTATLTPRNQNSQKNTEDNENENENDNDNENDNENNSNSNSNSENDNDNDNENENESDSDSGNETDKNGSSRKIKDSETSIQEDRDRGSSAGSSLTLERRSLKPTTTTEKVLPNINILVVEDNIINQAILGAFLRKHKIHFRIAKSGEEAIEKWRQGGFHLVLMDIHLPKMSGIEATKEIRRLEKLNNIGIFSYNRPTKQIDEKDILNMKIFRSPVIIVALTANTLASDRQEALAAGCNDYLTKPVNLLWLQNKITEWGCMQALIDFEGWQSGDRLNASPIGSSSVQIFGRSTASGSSSTALSSFGGTGSLKKFISSKT